jgi:hypothetical protein
MNFSEGERGEGGGEEGNVAGSQHGLFAQFL